MHVINGKTRETGLSTFSSALVLLKSNTNKHVFSSGGPSKIQVGIILQKESPPTKAPIELNSLMSKEKHSAQCGNKT